MNALQIFTTTDPKAVVDAYNAHRSIPVTLDEYNEFLNLIKTKVLIKSDLVIEIAHYKVESNNPYLQEETIDVHYLEGKQVYSMSFSPWGQSLACEIICEVPQPFTLVDQAAHLYFEMSFFGNEEETTEKENDVIDAVEEVLHMFGKDGIEAFENNEEFKVTKVEVIPDKTWTKVYKNGVLQNKSI